MFKLKTMIALATGAILSTSTMAKTPINSVIQPYLVKLQEQAKTESPGFQGFSAARGKKLYFAEYSHPEDPTTRSCTTCHTTDPNTSGETQVGKPIDPLTPSINQKRFSEVKQVKKWFRRNCKWVLQRQCNAVEKGDFVYFIHSL